MKLIILRILFLLVCSILAYTLIGMEKNMLDFHRLEKKDHIFDNAGIGQDFQISYQGEGIPIQATYILGKSYATNVPFISPYGWAQSVETPRLRRVWVTFDVRDIFHLLPNSIQKVLEQAKNANIIGNILVFGQPYSAFGERSYPKETNMRLHGWVAPWVNPPQIWPNNFNVNIDMGLFESYGISPSQDSNNAIGIGALKTQNVHYHNAFSPNNAKFMVDQKRDIASFWLVAFSQDKKQALVSYCLLFNSKNLENKEWLFVLGTPTMRKLLKNYETLIPLLQPNDQIVYKKVLQTIQELLNAQTKAQSQKKSKNILDFHRLEGKNHIFDITGQGNDLQISYQGEGKPLQATVIAGSAKNANTATNVPFISPYGWGQDVETPRRRRVWVTFNVHDIYYILPNSVRKILEQAKNANIIGNIVIFGQPYLELGGKNYPKETNMRLHSWVAPWVNPSQIWPDNFNVNIDMGLFESYGISPSQDINNALGIGKLKTQNVHYHNAFSPNNAKFMVDQNRDIASFWLVALSQDKKQALVSYCLLFNSENLEEQEEQIAIQSLTMGELLKKYEELIPLLQPSDQIAYKKVLQTVQELLNAQTKAQSQKKSEKIFDALIQLTQALQQLATQLR